jgi:tRNA G37 N-methylase TrmD
VRTALGLGPEVPVVLYTGTFEAIRTWGANGAMQSVVRVRPDAASSWSAASRASRRARAAVGRWPGAGSDFRPAAV